MTSRSSAALTIVDFGTGHVAGGHQDDYLAALEAALAEEQPEVLAPFRGGPAPASRLGTYIAEFRALWSRMHRGPAAGQLVVCHSPEFRDFVLFAAARALAPGAPVLGLFVLRRDAEGIVGRRNWKSWLLTRLVRAMLRRGWLYPLSDSPPVIELWSPGQRAALLSIPSPGAGAAAGGRPTGGPVIGLVGRLRMEKGARVYDAVIRAALALSPAARVEAQIGAGHAGEEREIAAALLARWAAEPRVHLIREHLAAEAYAALIAATDVVVLPYAGGDYGGGTSGVLHDAVALNRIALATRFPWAEKHFGDDPRVLWLAGVDEAALATGLREAVARALALRRSDPTGTPEASRFAADWRQAVADAATALRARHS